VDQVQVTRRWVDDRNVSARDWRAVREGETHAATKISHNRTPESFIVGVGASGILLAGAAILFVTVVGLASFKVWPTGQSGSSSTGTNVALAEPTAGAHAAKAAGLPATARFTIVNPVVPPAGRAPGGAGGGNGGGGHTHHSPGGGNVTPAPTPAPPATASPSPPSTGNGVGNGNGGGSSGNGNGGGSSGGTGSSGGGTSGTGSGGGNTDGTPGNSHRQTDHPVHPTHPSHSSHSDQTVAVTQSTGATQTVTVGDSTDTTVHGHGHGSEKTQH
jgi:hypothetical protein